jgi:HD superfamily phosphohydrolase
MSEEHGRKDPGMRAFSLAGLVPELAPPFAKTAPVRIPELRNVALTRRVLGVIDHPDFQRLRRVRQLGPTFLVYPGAVHDRFEHSIGVYENVRRYMMSLLVDPTFTDAMTERDILTGLAAGLLHDLGHYPFAHSLEALHHKGITAPHHEVLAGTILKGRLSKHSLGSLLRKEWGVDPDRVFGILARPPREHRTPVDAMLSSLLHGPIDADKMDYLERDSIHMGVPYGRNYDRDRLLSTLRINPANHTLAVTDKGKISAEIFIFCRYTMFSEAYWHHTVRSASAMVERALEDFRLTTQIGEEELLDLLLHNSDESLMTEIHRASPHGSACRSLVESFSRGSRRLFKRLLTLHRTHRSEPFRRAYELIFRMDRGEVHLVEESIRRTLSRLLGRDLHPWDVIVDTPPPGKDRIEDVDVLLDGPEPLAHPLSSLSRIVEGISADFVGVVKKIRVFVEPAAARKVLERTGKARLEELLLQTLLEPLIDT